MKKNGVIITLSVVTIALAMALVIFIIFSNVGNNHKYSWECDAVYHWRKCTDEDCQAVSDKAEHNFVRGACVCGKTYTIGLSYTLNDDEESWSVSGMGEVEETDIIIPRTHEGLPITRISSHAFAYNIFLKSVAIPEGVTEICSDAFNYCNNLNNIKIPNSVTIIGFDTFANCTSLTHVTIGNNMTTIITGAFNGCVNLSSVYYLGDMAGWCNIDFGDSRSNPLYYAGRLYIDDVCVTNGELVIPEGITKIGDCAFCGCTNVRSVSIPDTVTEIGDYAFSQCFRIYNITIPDSVTKIGYTAFGGCCNLTSITIASSVTEIGNYAFSGCNNLKYVYYKGSIEEWCSIRFKYGQANPMNYASRLYIDDACVSTGDLIIPDGVTQIGDFAFYGFDITSVVLPDTVTEIGSRAFGECTRLTSVTLPDGLTEIGEYVFADCTSLTSVNIPNSVTKIANGMFFYCSSLTSITIPSSVTKIDYSAFNDCTMLTNVYYEGDMAGWCNIDFVYESSNPLKYANNLYVDGVCVTNGELIIPDGVDTINQYAFAGCDAITSVILSDSVTKIGDYAFYRCSNLAHVTLADSVAKIGSHAFSGCNSLQFNEYNTELYLGTDDNPYFALIKAKKDSIHTCIINENTELIANSAFINIKLKAVVIPSSVRIIGYNAFQSYSYPWDNLRKVSYMGTLASWCNIEFDGLQSNPLYYAHNLYINDFCVTNGSLILLDITKINAYAFEGCSSITKLLILGTITEIGEQAFSGCSKLSEIRFDGTIAEWENISKGSLWNDNVPATKVICSDGEVSL